MTKETPSGFIEIPSAAILTLVSVSGTYLTGTAIFKISLQNVCDIFLNIKKIRELIKQLMPGKNVYMFPNGLHAELHNQ